MWEKTYQRKSDLSTLSLQQNVEHQRSVYRDDDVVEVEPSSSAEYYMMCLLSFGRDTEREWEMCTKRELYMRVENVSDWVWPGKREGEGKKSSGKRKKRRMMMTTMTLMMLMVVIVVKMCLEYVYRVSRGAESTKGKTIPFPIFDPFFLEVLLSSHVMYVWLAVFPSLSPLLSLSLRLWRSDERTDEKSTRLESNLIQLLLLHSACSSRYYCSSATVSLSLPLSCSEAMSSVMKVMVMMPVYCYYLEK